MPCANVHMLLAARLFERWEEEPARAPFSPGDAGRRNAFLDGSMAPDVGYYPGNDRLVSDLAHYRRSADLTRALLAEAGDGEELAFAWGWAAHALADAEIHPWIGRTCGHLRHGDRDRRMDASEDEAMHVAVETGLDATVQLREGPSLPRPPATSFLADGRIGLLERALARTYGVSLPPDALEAAYRRASRLMQGWRTTLSLLARTRGMRDGRTPDPIGACADVLAGTVRRFARPGTAMDGFLRPLCPDPWLIEETYRIADAFPVLMEAHVESGLAELENRNLETALPDGAVRHATAERTLERLTHLTGEDRAGPG